MPTYQYSCTACGEPLEIVQRFTDDALTECPACGGQLRKLYNAVGIVFRGSGFYSTDSRGGKTAASPASGASETKSDPGAASAPATPAPAAAAAASTSSSSSGPSSSGSSSSGSTSSD